MLKNLIAKAGVKAAMNPIADDMKRVDAMIHTSLGSGIHRVAEVADYITSSGRQADAPGARAAHFESARLQGRSGRVPRRRY